MKQSIRFRLLAGLLTLCMLFACMPMHALAADEPAALPAEPELLQAEPLNLGSITQLVAPESFHASDFIRRLPEEESLSTYVFQRANGEKTVYFFGA